MFVGEFVAVAVQEAVMVFVVHVVWTGRGGLLLVVVAVVVRVVAGVVVVEVEVLHEAGASSAVGACVVLRAGTRGDDERLSV